MNSRSIGYWTATLILAFCIGNGGIAELIQLPMVVGGTQVLGCLSYFISILGFWKILGVIALLAPGFLLLKEWAYAGIFFIVAGATVSHTAADEYGAFAFHVLVNLFFAGLVVASWWLQPDSRTVGWVKVRRDQ